MSPPPTVQPGQSQAGGPIPAPLVHNPQLGLVQHQPAALHSPQPRAVQYAQPTAIMAPPQPAILPMQPHPTVVYYHQPPPQHQQHSIVQALHPPQMPYRQHSLPVGAQEEQRVMWQQHQGQFLPAPPTTPAPAGQAPMTLPLMPPQPNEIFAGLNGRLDAIRAQNAALGSLCEICSALNRMSDVFAANFKATNEDSWKRLSDTAKNLS